MDPSIKWVGDTFENGWLGPRNKYIHTVGNTAKVKFVPVSNNLGFTGIFQGADYGYVRLSAAIQPDYTKTKSPIKLGNFAPGLGLKFLRDGVPSANLVAMWSVDGQDTWNFFQHEFTTHISDPTTTGPKVLAEKFKAATPLITSVGLSDFAQYGQDGKLISSPKFPFGLVFKPNPTLQSQYSNDFTEVFTAQLQRIPAGTTLYSVHAIAEPNSAPVLIGNLVLQSNPTTSYFGDKYMFFKHQDMQEDVKLRPEWKSHLLTSSSGCPFAKVSGFINKLF
jgi:hypothetical protein